MNTLVQVAVPSPLYGLFDYRWTQSRPVLPGLRVTVPFGRQWLVGIVIRQIATSAVPETRLRAVQRVHDTEPVLSADIMKLMLWASRYYVHPVGEVFSSALPVLLRQAKPAILTEQEYFSWTDSSVVDPGSQLRGAPLQQRIAHYLLTRKGQSVPVAALREFSARWRVAIQALQERGWVERQTRLGIPHNAAVGHSPSLLPEQSQAVSAIEHSLGRYQGFLLKGVTGSGKTEVYLRCIEAALRQDLQCLVMVPEIALTPQLMSRFEQRISGCLVSLHSALNDTERLQNWLCAAQGHADVVVGTRSSVLAPMPKLGLIIIDEEHDNSLKQQDGFRYHARDLALMRAREQGCPAVLGTATPSFESINNVNAGRLQLLELTQRAGDAVAPSIMLLDIRRRKLIEGMSDRLIEAIRAQLAEQGQVMVFINRRGFAPTLLCNDCGHGADCRRCDANMTVHAGLNRLRCHHCGAERPVPNTCEACGSAELDRVGYGTERIAAALEQAFPEVLIGRIDRDSTRRKGALEEQLSKAASGEARILVGTQMLAKGHHFPHLTLVCILDADRGLFGTDFRSLEHMGQLIIQVAGRAGRESRAGKVLVQTRNPDNPMLQTLVKEGYDAFAAIAINDRQQAGLPPFSHMALIRAEAADARQAHAFLRQVVESLEQNKSGQLQVLGPAPAPMERLGGRFRAQLLVQASKRSTLNDSLTHLVEGIDKLEGVRKCRWSIDVDPVDLF